MVWDSASIAFLIIFWDAYFIQVINIITFKMVFSSRQFICELSVIWKGFLNIVAFFSLVLKRSGIY